MILMPTVLGDEDIWIIDHINNMGLVKRKVIVLGLEVITIDQLEETGTFLNAIDELRLTDVLLQ